MLVANYRFLTRECLQVPNFDSHVRSAASQQISFRVKRQSTHNSRVTFKRALSIAIFVIPQTNSGVFRGRTTNFVNGMNNNFGNFSAVACELEFLRLAWHAISSFSCTTKRCAKSIAILTNTRFFKLFVLFFQIHYLLFESGQRRPLSLQVIVSSTARAFFLTLELDLCFNLEIIGSFFEALLYQVFQNSLIQFRSLLLCQHHVFFPYVFYI